MNWLKKELWVEFGPDRADKFFVDIRNGSILLKVIDEWVKWDTFRLTIAYGKTDDWARLTDLLSRSHSFTAEVNMVFTAVDEPQYKVELHRVKAQLTMLSDGWSDIRFRRC
jgi:hypothetical protein